MTGIGIPVWVRFKRRGRGPNLFGIWVVPAFQKQIGKQIRRRPSNVFQIQT